MKSEHKAMTIGGIWLGVGICACGTGSGGWTVILACIAIAATALVLDQYDPTIPQ